MSGLVLRLCKCCVGLLVKAANNIFSIQQVICLERDQSWPDKETFWWDKTKQNKRPTNKLKQKIKNLLLQNLELLILIVL